MLFKKRKKEIEKANQRKNKVNNQKNKNNQKSIKHKEKTSKKSFPQLAVTVMLDSKTGVVDVAANFKNLPLTRGMLEQAVDNVRQINTIRLNQLDRKSYEEHIHKQQQKDNEIAKENKEQMHKKIQRNN